MDKVPIEYVYLNFLNLSIPRNGGMFPRLFKKKLARKMIKKIESLTLHGPLNHLNIIREEIILFMQKEFARVSDVDPALFILDLDDQIIIVNMIIQISNEIRENGFRPIFHTNLSGCKMSSIVPQKSFMRRHIPIPRVILHSLLHNSGLFRDLPIKQHFLANDEAAAIYYWNLFDFTRLGIIDFNDFMGRGRKPGRKFSFFISTDGYALSFMFQRPVVIIGPEVKPQGIVDLPGDETWYVDPGQKCCFVAMKGISTEQNPEQIMKFSSKEYYYLAGINAINEAKHNLKRDNLLNPNIPIDQKIQLIESELPTNKTMNVGRYAVYATRALAIYPLMTAYYNQRFNKWKMYAYSGKQRSISQVIVLFNR